MKLVVVLKPIHCGYNVNNGIHIGVYDIEKFKSTYPFLDLNNKEYFYVTEYKPIADGTKVIYRGETFYTKLNTSKLTGRYAKYHVELEYELYKSMTNEKSKKHTAWESNFEICSFYFFINSEGAICQAFDGQKPNADIWRKHIGNYFTTKEDAANIVRELNDCDTTLAIKYTK